MVMSDLLPDELPAVVIEQGARTRRARLLEQMHSQGWDRVVLSSREGVQWLTGARFASPFRPLAWLDSDGACVLIAPHKVPEVHAADQAHAYPAKWLSTMRSEQTAAAVGKLMEVVDVHLPVGRVGIEGSDAPWDLTRQIASASPQTEFCDIDSTLFQLRRRKEADELALLRRAIAGTQAMYERARQIIRPGLTELALFNELQSVAVEIFDEPMTGTGNDYRCNARGGMPRGKAHAASAGELWILDLGPAYRGYWADNARTIAVTEPDEKQREAWSQIMEVFAYIEQSVRPGKSCKELFEEVQSMLDRSPVGRFDHHLGHGIGLHPHEAPHLNPNWNDHFEVGDVFTAEPGLYDAPQLRHGMRLENDYLVTETGVEMLTAFPLELK